MVTRVALVVVAIFASAAAAQTPSDDLVAARTKLGGACPDLCERLLDCALPDQRMSPRCVTGSIFCAGTCRPCSASAAECYSVSAVDTPDRKACLSRFGQCIRGGTATAMAGRSLIRFEGGDGTSMDSAVVVLGARNEFEGVAAEGVWVRQRFADWRKQDQALLRRDGRSYDRITYGTPDGPRDRWFDITDFFGKMD